jgi:stage III sporulation protein AD
MNILSLAAMGLIAAVLSIVIRQYKPEFSIYISLTAGVIILIAAISAVRPVLDVMSGLSDKVEISSVYTAALLKSLAVCYVVQLAADTCKDAGENAIAAKIETAGKFAVVIIALPLFNELVELVTGLVG